jgi:hypothetical protein
VATRWQITKFGDAMAGEGGAATEGVLGVEDKVLGLPLYKEPVIFFFLNFPIGFSFSDFCRVCDINFFISILTKNLEINPSFLQYFISKK